MCCGQNFASSCRYCMCCVKIWHLRRQKFACLKVVLSFFEKFSKFFLFSMVKVHFLQKVLKKWSSFRKKIKKIPLLGLDLPLKKWSNFFLKLDHFLAHFVKSVLSPLKIPPKKICLQAILFGVPLFCFLGAHYLTW